MLARGAADAGGELLIQDLSQRAAAIAAWNIQEKAASQPTKVLSSRGGIGTLHVSAQEADDFVFATSDSVLWQGETQLL